MDLIEFEGREYGPVGWRVAADSVDDFIDLTGDDPGRWSENAPPGFAASALFAVAPDLLGELYDRSVIHGEQTFTWHQPIGRGALLVVAGVVTKIRERGGVNFVTFEISVTDGSETVLTGRSLFLVAGEAVPAGQTEFERPEPPHSYGGDPGARQFSASRADLVRYASATRDWNPVHWDHDAGVAAGFPGVVVHGLLQAGWALQVAGSVTRSARPFDSAKVRFRNPLLPARPVDSTLDQGDSSVEVTLSDADLVYLSAVVDLADE